MVQQKQLQHTPAKCINEKVRLILRMVGQKNFQIQYTLRVKSFFNFRINNYRRRFFCSPDDKEDCLKTLGLPIKKEDCFLNDSMSQKLKHSHSHGFMVTMNDEKFRKS